jgi:hypothetical protein
MRDRRPNSITEANAGGPRHLPSRTRWAARIAQFFRSAASHNAQHPAQLRERPWLWIPVCTVFALLIYLAGAITARVMYERGTLRQGSSTFRVLESFYTPLQTLCDSSPTFLRGYEACVAIFVPEKKDDNR